MPGAHPASARADPWFDYASLDQALRDELDARAPRATAALKPIKVKLGDCPSEKHGDSGAPVHPQKPQVRKRAIRFSRELCIEADDCIKNAPADYFRLARGKDGVPGSPVRHRRLDDEPDFARPPPDHADNAGRRAPVVGLDHRYAHERLPSGVCDDPAGARTRTQFRSWPAQRAAADADATDDFLHRKLVGSFARLAASMHKRWYCRCWSAPYRALAETEPGVRFCPPVFVRDEANALRSIAR